MATFVIPAAWKRRMEPRALAILSRINQLFDTSSLPKCKTFLIYDIVRPGHHILVASNTDRITSLVFNPRGPTLNVASKIVVGSHPMSIRSLDIQAINPALAFTGLEQEDGVVVALTFGETGNGTNDGDRVAAELLLAPALAMDVRNSSSYGPGDGAARRTPFLYATNRNDPSPEGDTVAIFSLDNRTAPVRVAEVHTGLRHLRGVATGGGDGRWMMLGGMLGGGVKVYERVDGGRLIKEIAALPDIEGPTGFLWIRPPHVGI